MMLNLSKSFFKFRPNQLNVFAFSSSAYEGTFKDRAAGKAQLKEFYKFTHPDFFGNAPTDVKQTNETSMQTLNSYLQSTQTLN